MGAYGIRRLIHAVLVILLIDFVCFVIVALLVDVSVLPPRDVEHLRQDLGLTGPLPAQFLTALAGSQPSRSVAGSSNRSGLTRRGPGS